MPETGGCPIEGCYCGGGHSAVAVRFLREIEIRLVEKSLQGGGL